MEEMNERKDYALEIEELLKSNLTNEEIKDQLDDYHENDIAEAFENASKEARFRLYKILDAETMSEIFSYIEEPKRYIAELDEEQAADILEEMDVDDAIDLLEELDEEEAKNLIDKMENDAKEDINLIQSYEEDELGSMMTTNFIVIPYNSTIREAMRELIHQAEENDNIKTLYVEKDGKFYGAIDLKDLIIARDYNELDDITVNSYPYVYDHDKVEDKINYIQDYEEDSIPVLNDHNEILGVITAHDIVEMVDQEMGEDLVKLAGLTAEEDLKEPLLESLKKRIPWLVILLVLGLFVSSVVGIFELVVATLPLVMAFQSLICGMAGNVGTQSLAVTIRAISDESAKTKQLLGLIFSEARVGLCNGAMLGTVAFAALGLYIHFFKDKPWHFAYLVSGCIGIALIVTMMISSAMGTLIPIFFKSVGVDPAVASGPLITTVNDLVAVVTYYGLCWLLLIQILGV